MVVTKIFNFLATYLILLIITIKSESHRYNRQ